MVCVKYWKHGISATTFTVWLTIVVYWWGKKKYCCLPPRGKFVIFHFLCIGLIDLYVRNCKDGALEKPPFWSLNCASISNWCEQRVNEKAKKLLGCWWLEVMGGWPKIELGGMFLSLKMCSSTVSSPLPFEHQENIKTVLLFQSNEWGQGGRQQED